MDITLRDNFILLWQKYFPSAELPVTFELGKRTEGVTLIQHTSGQGCMICPMTKARKGTPIVYDATSTSCPGGLIATGFQDTFPNVNYFFAKGVPGAFEGIRCKQTPEIAAEFARNIPKFPKHDKEIIVKRWDLLTETDNPDVVIFFARPEVMTGLFLLANYDRGDVEGVFSPMGSTCSTTFLYPYLEQQKENPRAVISGFDAGSRACIPLDMLIMAFPMKMFEKVVGFMDESFLCTQSWETVKKKIDRSTVLHACQ